MTPRHGLAESAEALRRGVLHQRCWLVGGQQRAHRGSVSPARATGEFVQSAGAIPRAPLLDSADAHADDCDSFFRGSASLEQGECLEALGYLGVGCVVVVCVEFFGSVFPVSSEFSSAHRCSADVRRMV